MRADNWAYRLVVFIESRRDMPHEWGRNDCVTFAADALVAMGLGDPVPDRSWSSEAEALAAITGVGGLESQLDARFPRATIPKRGDIGLIGSGAIALVYPPVVLLPGDNRLRQLKLSACRSFWAT